MTTYTGTNGDDIFTGGAENDNASGNGGNDQLSGGGGDDTIGGGTGADVINGNDGNDWLYAFNISPPFNRPYYGNPWTPPVLDTGAEFDILSGGAGSDTLFAGYGDSVDGGADSDTLYISFMGAPSGVTVDFRQLQNNGTITIGGATITNIEGIGWIEGSNFDDTIRDSDASSNFAPMFGRGGDDHLYGGYYTGDIHGGDGDDIIDRGSSPYGFQHFGEAGNDLLIGSYNGELLDGGDGNDELRGHGGFDDLFGGNGNDLMDAGSYDDRMSGGAGNDTMYGAGDPDIMDGGAGDDTMYGDFSLIAMGNGLSPSRNDESMFGGTGADTLYGDEGDDRMWSGERDGPFGSQGLDDIGLEHDRLFGGTGNDTMSIGYGDDADGGSGSDSLRIVLSGASSGVTIDTSAFAAGGAWSLYGGTIQNVETLTAIIGTAFADVFTIATHGFGIGLELGDGDDVVTSFNSSINVNGGNGNDRFINGNAGDTINGGSGIDTLDYRNATSGVTVTLALLAGGIGSGPGGDQVSNIENTDGSGFGDTLRGSNFANVLRGLAGDDTLEGHGGDDFLDGGAGADQLRGGAGNDVYSIEDGLDTLVEAVEGGNDTVYSALNLTLAAGVEIETLATLNGGGTDAIDLAGNEFGQSIYGNAGSNRLSGDGGNDLLVGGAGDDTLNGGSGNDVLDGGAGADVMQGGTGDDIYWVNEAGDSVGELAGEGRDTLYTMLDYTLAAHAHIEILSAADNGGSQPLNLNGNALANELWGTNGANALNGGGGADVLLGFGGDDVYYVDQLGDDVYESAGQGRDIVYAFADYELTGGSHVEIVSAADNGSAAALNLAGNERANELWGTNGANALNGAGGADFLLGFGGDDIYYVDQLGDDVYEIAGQGRDIVYAFGSYQLTGGSHVEVLSSANNSSTLTQDLTGNELANELWGTNGANVLNGAGGADVMLGFGGDDVYYVDAAGDFVIEGAGAGRDTVYAFGSYSLNAGAHVEILSSASNGSTLAQDLNGNELANELWGTNGVNVLDGGAGADVMLGFGGDDIYYVDAAGDFIIEGAGAGRDTVYAFGSYSLNAGAHVEILSSASNGSTVAQDLTGNELANELWGTNGANVLDGGGGADVLIGFGGDDRYAFTTALGGGNADIVIGFEAGIDKVALDDAVFTGLVAGPGGSLDPNAFRTGSAAQDTDDRIIYDPATGNLFYDADGNGAGAAILFATVQGAPPLNASDFIVF